MKIPVEAADKVRTWDREQGGGGEGRRKEETGVAEVEARASSVRIKGIRGRGESVGGVPLAPRDDNHLVASRAGRALYIYVYIYLSIHIYMYMHTDAPMRLSVAGLLINMERSDL